KLLLTPCQQRGLASLSLRRTLCAGRLGRQRAGDRRDDGLGRGDDEQNEKANCEGACQPPETSPGHGPVSALPQAVSNSRVTGFPGTRRVSDRAGEPPRLRA